jgi:hypothetical protein
MVPLALCFLAQAFASSFYEQPFPETVRNAPAVVRGKIGKSETQWTTLPDGSKHLFTYYDVEVSEGFKGGPRTGAPIRIRELGGSKDGVSLNVSGTAGFEKGEDVVVMLGEPNAQVDGGAYPLQGMMMGKFVVEKGADGKEYLRGPGIGSNVHPGLRNEHSEEKTAQISLDALREIIKTQAAEPKPSPTVVAKVREEGTLLSAKASANGGPKTEIHDENLVHPADKPASPTRPILFGFGAAIGIAWFLKSRKKRR